MKANSELTSVADGKKNLSRKMKYRGSKKEAPNHHPIFTPCFAQTLGGDDVGGENGGIGGG